MSNYPKELPSGDLELNLSISSGRSITSLRIPEVREPMPGRHGKELANEVREKLFRLVHQLVLEKLAMESIVILSDYAMEVVDEGVARIVDRYYSGKGRHIVANAVMKEMMETSIRNLTAEVRVILENHMRSIGEIL